MSKGGGDKTTQISEIPEWARPYAQNLLTTGAAVTSQPYQQFMGMRVAPMNTAQEQAMGMVAGTALGGSPDTNAARGQIVSTLSGDYQNPWSTTWNPFAMQGNPMLENVVNKSMGDISSNYMKSIAPQTDTMFARAGVFGGSAYNDRLNQNQAALGQTLANASNQLRFQDYGQQAQLTESALQRGSGAYEAERARQMQAVPLGLQGTGLDFTAASKLAGVGDAQRQYTQDLLNESVSEFDRQQNYPYRQIDVLGAILGKSLGGSSQTTTTSTGGYRASPIAGAIGGGMLGYGVQQMFPQLGQMGQYAPWLGAGLGALGTM